MKPFFPILAALLLTSTVFAQSPEKISYQAVIRNSSDQLVVNTQVGMRISIEKYIIGIPPSYQNVYVETHTQSTNDNGLVTIQVGGGTVAGGNFATIDWSAGDYFIKTETDPAGGTNYTITGRSQLLSVPYALYAKNAKTYKVGDFAQGGIVFWVDETGQHGLVCAKTDQSSGMRWNPGTNGNTRAYGNGPYSGEMNTAIIIAAHVAIGDDGNTYAARMCNELQVFEGGKSYGDWYLPSRTELNIMYVERTKINATALLNGGSAFASGNYWSSTEYNDIRAYYFDLNDGTSNFNTKGINTYLVRAVRAF